MCSGMAGGLLGCQAVTSEDMPGRRVLSTNDVCSMSDDYLEAAIRQARMRHCHVFLADDKMQKQRAKDIVRRYNASVFSFGAHNNPATRVFRLYMDMLILIRACYFIGNPASTIAGNIARVRALSLNHSAGSNILAGPGHSEKCLGVVS